MDYQVDFDPRALKDLEHFNRQIAQRIVNKCSILEQSPFKGPNIRHLRSNIYRLRIGDWRAVYIVEGSKVSIIAVIHRGDTYKRAFRRL